MKKFEITKKELFVELKNIVANSAIDESKKALYKEMLDNELSIITKKANSKVNKENEELNAKLKEIILEVLSKAEKPLTVTEIQAQDERLSLSAGITNSKVTTNLTKLLKEGAVKNSVVKKKSYYYI